MTAVVKKVVKKFAAPAAENPAALPYLAAAGALNEAEPAPVWIKALRETGYAAFAETGMPAPTTEGWQYTNLRPIKPENFVYTTAHVDADDVTAADLPAKLAADAVRIVLVNGRLRPDLGDMPAGLPAGLSVTPLADATAAQQESLVSVGDLSAYPMVALNTAYLRDGIVVETAKGADIDRPVEVLFYNTGENSATYPRVVYRLAENSGMTVYERHTGKGRYFTNIFAVYDPAAASRFRVYKFVDESKEAFHFSHALLRQGRDASFEAFSLASRLAGGRQETRLQLINPGLLCSIGGIYLLRESQSHDFTVLADHFEPDCTSVQHFKGVIDDQARAVFQGKIHVHRPAQKTDGYQSHHALLLSTDAEANAKPELEIYADDVRCSHGATAGCLDESALFYMQSRGIPADEARGLLIRSFLAENLERLTDETARALYLERIVAWLEQGKS